MKFSDLIDDDESDEGILESALREDVGIHNSPA